MKVKKPIFSEMLLIFSAFLSLVSVSSTEAEIADLHYMRILDGATTCQPGKYASPDAGAEDPCKPCGPGRWSDPGGGQATCEVCGPGRYSTAEIAASCNACTAGTFITGDAKNQNDHDEATDCQACPSGKVSESGASECTDCTAGKYAPSEARAECEWCPAGKTSADAGADCYPCGAGKYRDATGTACTSCGSGRYKAKGSEPCKVCQGGKYSASEEAEACVTCPDGKYISNGGAASMHDAEEDCANCPTGKHSTSTRSACSSCEAGKYSESGDSSCVVCPAGQYESSGGNGACEKCPKGKFISDNGGSSDKHDSADDCNPCGAGRYSNEEGSGSCFSCGPGKFSLEGSAECSICGIGKYSEKLSGICESCPAGKFNANDDTDAGEHDSIDDCKDCASGKASGEGQGSCDDCEIGKFSEEGYEACATCRAGTFSDVTSASSCKSCPSGKANFDDGIDEAKHDSEDDCEQCPPGRYSRDGGLKECLPCELGKYASGNGTTSCTVCEAGKYTHDFATSICKDCPGGKYNDDDSKNADKHDGVQDCITCEIGKSAKPGDGSSCEDCTAGRYAAEKGKWACEICGAGKYSSNPGASKCTDCPSGKAIPDRGSEADKHDSEDDCENCEAGKYMREDGFGCFHCGPGRYSESGSASCTICGAGKYATQLISPHCDNCPAGKNLPDDGAYAAYHDDIKDCKDCATGEYSASGASECAVCKPGKKLVDSGSEEESVACAICEADTYSTGATTDCASCPPGKFISDNGSDALEHDAAEDCKFPALAPTAAPTASPTAAPATPFECDPGEYNEMGGSSRIFCQKCKAGKYSAAGSSSCTNCPVGKHSREKSSSCAVCPKGTYSRDANRHSCIPCPAGKSTTDDGLDAQKHKSKKDCSDIDSCATNPYSCGNNTNCFDLVAPDVGFKCTCMKGYHGSESKNTAAICEADFSISGNKKVEIEGLGMPDFPEKFHSFLRMQQISFSLLYAGVALYVIVLVASLRISSSFSTREKSINFLVAAGCLFRTIYILSNDASIALGPNRFYGYFLRAVNDILWFSAFALISFYWHALLRNSSSAEKKLIEAAGNQAKNSRSLMKKECRKLIAGFAVLRLCQAFSEMLDARTAFTALEISCTLFVVFFNTFLILMQRYVDRARARESSIGEDGGANFGGNDTEDKGSAVGIDDPRTALVVFKVFWKSEIFLSFLWLVQRSVFMYLTANGMIDMQAPRTVVKLKVLQRLVEFLMVSRPRPFPPCWFLMHIIMLTKRMLCRLQT